MSRSRRTFSKEFKSKVVPDALREKETIDVLAKRHELLPTQISAWKAEAVRNISAVFTSEKPAAAKEAVPAEKLYAQIGQLKVENDFLKKKLC